MKGTQEKVKLKKTASYYIEIVLIILIIIAIIIAGYAFAKYLTSITGGTEADVARWHFDVTNGTKDSTGLIQFAMTRTDTNTAVAKDKLAPGTSGEFKIVIDTTGTEVSLRYDVEINLNECPKNLVFYKLTDITAQVAEDAFENKNGIEPLSKFGDKLLITRYLPVKPVNHVNRSTYRNYILGMAFRYRHNTSTKR